MTRYLGSWYSNHYFINCEDICDKVVNAALGNKDNKLNKLFNWSQYKGFIFTNKSPTKSKTDRFKNTFVFVTVPKVQLNDSVLMLLYIICMNFEYWFIVNYSILA